MVLLKLSRKAASSAEDYSIVGEGCGGAGSCSSAACSCFDDCTFFDGLSLDRWIGNTYAMVAVFLGISAWAIGQLAYLYGAVGASAEYIVGIVVTLVATLALGFQIFSSADGSLEQWGLLRAAMQAATAFAIAGLGAVFSQIVFANLTSLLVGLAGIFVVVFIGYTLWQMGGAVRCTTNIMELGCWSLIFALAILMSVASSAWYLGLMTAVFLAVPSPDLVAFAVMLGVGFAAAIMALSRYRTWIFGTCGGVNIDTLAAAQAVSYAFYQIAVRSQGGFAWQQYAIVAAVSFLGLLGLFGYQRKTVAWASILSVYLVAWTMPFGAVSLVFFFGLALYIPGLFLVLSTLNLCCGEPLWNIAKLLAALAFAYGGMQAVMAPFAVEAIYGGLFPTNVNLVFYAAAVAVQLAGSGVGQLIGRCSCDIALPAYMASVFLGNGLAGFLSTTSALLDPLVAASWTSFAVSLGVLLLYILLQIIVYFAVRGNSCSCAQVVFLAAALTVWPFGYTAGLLQAISLGAVAANLLLPLVAFAVFALVPQLVFFFIPSCGSCLKYVCATSMLVLTSVGMSLYADAATALVVQGALSILGVLNATVAVALVIIFVLGLLVLVLDIALISVFTEQCCYPFAAVAWLPVLTFSLGVPHNLAWGFVASTYNGVGAQVFLTTILLLLGALTIVPLVAELLRAVAPFWASIIASLPLSPALQALLLLILPQAPCIEAEFILSIAFAVMLLSYSGAPLEFFYSMSLFGFNPRLSLLFPVALYWPAANYGALFVAFISAALFLLVLVLAALMLLLPSDVDTNISAALCALGLAFLPLGVGFGIGPLASANAASVQDYAGIALVLLPFILIVLLSLSQLP